MPNFFVAAEIWNHGHFQGRYSHEDFTQGTTGYQLKNQSDKDKTK